MDGLNIEYGIRYVAPSYATIDEGALLLIEDSNRTFNEMMRNIGISELQSFEESGDVVVYEAGNKIKELFDTVIKWFKEKFEAFKGWLDTQLKKMQEKINKFKNTVKTKEISRLTKMANRLVEKKDKDDKIKNYGKTYQYLELDKMMDCNSGVWKAITDYAFVVRSDFSKNINNRTNFGAEDSQMNKEFKDAFDSYKKKIIQHMNPGASTNASYLENASSLQTIVKEYIRGEEIDVTKKYIVSNVKDMVEFAFDFNKSKNAVKKIYNGLKKEFDEDIKFINKYKKDPIIFNSLSRYLSYMKWGKNVAVTVGTATISCMWEKVFKDMGIILRLHVAAKSYEPVSESTTFQTELASLLNF